MTSSPVIGKYCGTSTPPVFVSQSNEIRIEFHTDQESAEKGFRLQYLFVSNGKPNYHYLLALTNLGYLDCF